MKRTLQVCAALAVVLALVPVVEVGGQADDQAAAEQQAIQEQEAIQEQDVDPQAGFFFWAGGPVRGKRARTQTTGTLVGSAPAWVSLPGAGVAWSAVTPDLLNVAFSAECQKVGGGVARIRIARYVGGVFAGFMEPYDGFQTFCSASLPATHKGNWAQRVGLGTHTVLVQIQNTVGTVWIDDWTLELVAYD